MRKQKKEKNTKTIDEFSKPKDIEIQIVQFS